MIYKKKSFKIFDSDALKNFHKRIFFSIIIFSSFYFIAIFRITDVMVFNVNENSFIEKDLNYSRGKIYDRNGYLLATNIKSHSLYANSSKIKNTEILSQRLSQILKINEEDIYKKLNSKKRFVYIKRNISPIEHQKIINLGEINLQTIIENKRIYPYKNIGSHIVGFVDVDNRGKSGVELGYENLLSKNEDIFLTIDINLQNAVKNELLNTIKKFSAESGSIIIMDIENSEILSLINYPDFDPNNFKNSNNNERLNRVLQSNYEMGSTFKPLTIAMGIEKKIIKKDMIFDVSKPIRHINDWDPCKCYLSVKDVIVKSSNIGTAKIAKLIGKENQMSFFDLIGFNNPINIDLNEATQPLGNRNNWGKMETMTIGYGYGFAITPMHLAVAYNAILNSGKKRKPKILLNDNDDSFIQVVSEDTSKYIASLLRAVIDESKFTGPRVKIDGYEIGGKSGTAELTDFKGNYDEDSNRTIFISAFPMSKPKYLILTFVDKPKRMKHHNYSITSATVNAPLVKNIIEKLIQILRIPKFDESSILKADTSLQYNTNNAVN